MSKTRFGRGASTLEESADASREALAEATTDLEPADVVLAVVMASPAQQPELIIETVESELGDVPIVGATSTGEFTDEIVTEGGIVIALLASDELETATALANGVSENVFATVERAVDQLPPVEELAGEHTAAITFHDGLAGNGEQISLVTNQLLGNVALAGGSAGDDLAMEKTLVFTEDGVADNGVAIALISGDRPFGLGINHGHEPISPTYEVTKAEGNVVLELDGEPAYDVWMREVADLAQREYGIDVESVSGGDQEQFTLLTQFEFGIPTGENSYKIRWPGMTDSTDGSLVFATSVPAGTEGQIMHGTKEEVVSAAGKTAKSALSQLDETDPAGALVFDCACRELLLEEEYDTAIEAVSNELPVPFAGFETYGEICMPPGAASGYHNTTMSVLLIPE